MIVIVESVSEEESVVGLRHSLYLICTDSPSTPHRELAYFTTCLVHREIVLQFSHQCPRRDVLRAWFDSMIGEMRVRTHV